MFKVVLSDGVSFKCSETQTILEAAKSSGIAIEHSCRSGRCGSCLAEVPEGKTKALIPEIGMSADDKDAGRIFTCCRAPLTDIFLDIRDLGEIGKLKTLTLPCRIDSIAELSEDVVGIVLKFPSNSGFKFFPGQYVDLIKGGTRRSYSIANAPREDEKLELHIKRIEGGVMSDVLFRETEVNDLFRIEGPFGTFSYADDNEENIILMATGTGIAPIKSLLEGFTVSNPGKKVFVIWGGRREEDLYLDLSSFKNIDMSVRALSREQIEGCYYGYVQSAVMSLGLDLTECSVYACGSGLMINSARDSFIENGLPARRFKSDAFVSSS